MSWEEPARSIKGGACEIICQMSHCKAGKEAKRWASKAWRSRFHSSFQGPSWRKMVSDHCNAGHSREILRRWFPILFDLSAGCAAMQTLLTDCGWSPGSFFPLKALAPPECEPHNANYVRRRKTLRIIQQTINGQQSRKEKIVCSTYLWWYLITVMRAWKIWMQVCFNLA